MNFKVEVMNSNYRPHEKKEKRGILLKYNEGRIVSQVCSLGEPGIAAHHRKVMNYLGYSGQKRLKEIDRPFFNIFLEPCNRVVR